MKDLILNLKGEYFDKIEFGTKYEEFRECTKYWKARLLVDGKHRKFGRIIIRRGYPKTGDTSRELVRPWRGFIERKMVHKEFGEKPTSVFAIRVN